MAAVDEAIRLYQQGMGRISARPNKAANQKQSRVENFSGRNNPYQQYQQSVVKTASPQELTLMLYNGLVKFLKLAHQGIEEKDMEKANNNIIKSENIITEFIRTLDPQYEVSGALLSLYEYMNRRLIEANIKKDKSAVEEVIGYAEELRDTWAQAMKLAKQQAPDTL